MTECKSQHSTPVRHDDLPYKRQSLRSRLLISSNPCKAKRSCAMDKDGIEPQILSSTKIYEPSFFNRSNVEDYQSGSFMWEESALITDLKRMGDTSTQNMNSSSSDSCDDMETSIVHQERHSTPQDRKFSVRAVSSTPNQEMFSINKCTRSVFTQTNFTLNVREEEEIITDLKSFYTEIPEGEICLKKVCLDTSEPSSSSSRDCSNKFIQCEDTPIQNKQLVRKLSLRSKTMICSALEKSKDLPRKGLLRHKSMEEKRIFSNTFSLMPHHKTPPSCTGKVFHNPFEVDLPDRLSKSIFSPDVFENVVSPSQDAEDLRWTIEDISSINPVPIDEDFSIPSDEDDPERESQVQREIDRYFSETHFVLSPEDLPKSSSVVEILKSDFTAGAAASTPRKVNVNVSKELKNCSTQTSLSLPEMLPVELEGSLRSYFKFIEADELNLSQCNLRRKLFFHAEDEAPSPVRFEINSSPFTKDSWKTESSPLSVVSRERHFTPVGHQQYLSSPEMSPVDYFSSPKIKDISIMACKKTLINIFRGDNDEVKAETKKAVVNSTAIATGDMDSSCQPSSQDTGYHTEDSACLHMHFSTPTRSAV